MRLRVPNDTGVSLADAVAAGLAVLAAGEFVASRYFDSTKGAQAQLIASLLMWEGIAMLACAGIIWVRQDFGVSTIISLVSIWMAGAGVGLLRAGFFDAPHE